MTEDYLHNAGEDTYSLSESFEDVFRSHYKRLCLYAFRFIQDESTCEDVVQDCFVKVWQKRKTIDFNRPTGLLYKMVRENSLDYLKKRRPMPLVNEDKPEFQENVQVREIVYAETIQKLHELINNLPPKCGAVMKKILYLNKEYSEISKELNISESTVRNQKARAISLLRLHLNKTITLISFTILSFLSCIK